MVLCFSCDTRRKVSELASLQTPLRTPKLAKDSTTTKQQNKPRRPPDNNGIELVHNCSSGAMCQFVRRKQSIGTVGANERLSQQLSLPARMTRVSLRRTIPTGAGRGPAAPVAKLHLGIITWAHSMIVCSRSPRNDSDLISFDGRPEKWAPTFEEIPD